MKKTLAVLFMTAALAVPAAAQTSTSTSGVVVSSTTESLVVRMDDGTQRTFNVTSTTTLPSARLVEGNRVTVQYRPLDAGLFEAARVELITVDRQPMPAQTPDRTTTADTTATQPTTADDRDTLPATASPMPLLAMTGLAALVAGLVAKARRTA